MAAVLGSRRWWKGVALALVHFASWLIGKMAGGAVDTENLFG